MATIVRRPFLPFLLFSLAFLASPKSAAQDSLILERSTDSPRAAWLEEDRTSATRKFIDLSGEWSLTIGGAEPRTVQVPVSLDLEGDFVFQRTFTVDERTLKSSSLQIVALGINLEAEFYINEMFVGKHVGGYSSIDLEIPDDVLQIGPENVLKVIVSNRLNATSTLPLRKQIWGWKNYGGIFRDIYIRVTPRIWISQMSTRTTFDPKTGRGRLEIAGTVSTGAIVIETQPPVGSRRSPQHQIRFEVFDPTVEEPIAESRPLSLDLQPDSDIPVEAQLDLRSVRAWTPETPERYRLRASIVLPGELRPVLVDERTSMVGFGAMAIEKQRLQWNGSPVTLRGVVWHEQWEGQGASLSAEQMEQDVRMIKTLGANAVRFAFHPPHPFMVELCDRYGLYVLEEIPIWNVPASVIASEPYWSLADASARAMVTRDRSHVAVLAWGLGSQVESSSADAVSALTRLVSAVRELDSRPLYLGITGSAADSLSELMDFAALSVGDVSPARFDRLLTDFKSRHADKPLLLVAYGHPVEFGNRNGYSDPLSEEAQARYFVQTAPIIRDAKIAGSFVNAFADWRGDRPIMTLPFRTGQNHPLGLTNGRREPTLAYEYVRALYAGQRTTALPIGSSRSSFPVVHIIAGFAVIFLIAYLYNYNRRFQDSFKRALTRTYNFYSDLRDVRIVSPLHTMLVALAVSLTLGVFMSSLLFHFRTDTRLDYLLSLLVSDAVKEPIITLAWDPLMAIAVATALSLMVLVVCALVLKVLSILLRARVRPFHLLTIIAWGGLPLVFLSPISMALFKILTSPFYVIPVFALIGVMLLWSTVRILKGFAVVADIPPMRAYIVAVVLAGIAVAALAFYGESETALISYVRLFLAIVGGLV